MAGFDWYQATIPASVDEVLAVFMESGESCRSLSHGRGHHGYGTSTSVSDDQGKVATVWHGGTHAYPHVVLSSEAAQDGAELIRAHFPHHFVTRADVREDFGDEGAFDRITPVMLAAAQSHRVKVGCAGDWALTMKARTLYLGSPSSTCRQRLYDKAAELRAKFAADPVRLASVPEHLVRLEAQVRPASREAKERFASIEPLAVMGSSRWLRDVWRGVVGLELEPVQVGKPWRQSDDERAYAYLLAQYGSLLERMASVQGWDCLGLQLRDDLRRREAAKRAGSAP